MRCYGRHWKSGELRIPLVVAHSTFKIIAVTYNDILIALIELIPTFLMT